MSPRFISFFSGCGGLDLGFIQAGFSPIAAFDNWQVAVDNYNRNIGSHAQKLDLAETTLQIATAPCDVVLAGSPCQGFSTIGKRQLEDPRNGLLAVAVEQSVRLRPKVIVLENVPGVLLGAHRQYWEYACSALESAGYKTRTIILDAKNCGLAQSRKRVIVVAWNSKKSFEADPKISRVACLSTALAGASKHPNHAPTVLARGSREYKIATRIGPGQKLCDVRAGTASVHSWMIPEVFGQTGASERETLTALMRLRRQRRVRNYGDADPVSARALGKLLGRPVAPELGNLLRKGFVRKIGKDYDLQRAFNGKYRRLESGGISFAVDTKFGDPKYFLHPKQQRGFSVREAARLQGFPDSYVFDGAIRDQFKMIGNAVPVGMGKVVADMILSSLF